MLARRTKAVVWLALICLGCALFGRYVYYAKTRVEVKGGADGFTESDLKRAESVAAYLAEKCRLRPGEEVYGSLEGEGRVSAREKPPREFLTEYARKLQPATIPIALRLEVSEDRRTLFFTAADYEHGTPSKFLDCLREGLKASVDREFQGTTIVHEVEVVGPIYTHP